MSSANDPLSPSERTRLEALRSAADLAALRGLTGEESLHDAYFAAKREWRTLRDRELPPADTAGGLPGDTVTVDGVAFHVHGVTHADTDAERSYLREHVDRFVGSGEAVYCEQGIRPMYFEDVGAVCAMDDYRWALAECERLETGAHLGGSPLAEFEGFAEDVGSLTSRFREAAFSLIESGSDVYGEEFARVLGDVATEFLTSHEDVATAHDFESFALSRRAAREPELLGALQRYYKTTFLPQPIEREWLRRHDPELELVSHARNERMADYVVFHADDVEDVHLIVGAAHQPGVVYYLGQHRDGDRDVEGFELVE